MKIIYWILNVKPTLHFKNNIMKVSRNNTPEGFPLETIHYSWDQGIRLQESVSVPKRTGKAQICDQQGKINENWYVFHIMLTTDSSMQRMKFRLMSKVVSIFHLGMIAVTGQSVSTPSGSHCANSDASGTKISYWRRSIHYHLTFSATEKHHFYFLTQVPAFLRVQKTAYLHAAGREVYAERGQGGF